MNKRVKKLLAAILLLVGLPVYVLVAARIVSSFDRPSFLLELFIYVALGACWALPLKKLFKGIAR